VRGLAAPRTDGAVTLAAAEPHQGAVTCAARPLTTCPRCAKPAVRIEIRQRFELGELVERFGSRPVPAKFALADIGGRTVCFDFEEG